jgi:hypothetical protein
VDSKTAAILRGQLYNSEKKEPVIQMAGPGRGNKTKGNSCPPLSTAEKVAKQTGVSPRTVKNDSKFAQAAEALGITADIVAGKDKRTRKEIVAAAKAGRLATKGNPKCTRTEHLEKTSDLGITRKERAEAQNLAKFPHQALKRIRTRVESSP